MNAVGPAGAGLRRGARRRAGDVTATPGRAAPRASAGGGVRRRRRSVRASRCDRHRTGRFGTRGALAGGRHARTGRAGVAALRGGRGRGRAPRRAVLSGAAGRRRRAAGAVRPRRPIAARRRTPGGHRRHAQRHRSRTRGGAAHRRAAWPMPASTSCPGWLGASTDAHIAPSSSSDGPGRAIGVVASGLDVVYPREHRELWRRVADDGRAACRSRRPAHHPEAFRFPLRNRIIAGLAEVVVVVESRRARRLVDHRHAGRRAGHRGDGRAGKRAQPCRRRHQRAVADRCGAGARRLRRARRAGAGPPPCSTGAHRDRANGPAGSTSPCTRRAPASRARSTGSSPVSVPISSTWRCRSPGWSSPAGWSRRTVGTRPSERCCDECAQRDHDHLAHRRAAGCRCGAAGARRGHPGSDAARGCTHRRRARGDNGRCMAAPLAHADAWRVDDFAASLTAASANTVAAYRSDVSQFAEWAGRGSVMSPSGVDRLLLRRYVAALTTRRLAKRSIARKAAALRRYFGWARRAGLVAVDPSLALRAPTGEGRLPRVLDGHELDVLLGDEPVAGGRRGTRVADAARQRRAGGALRQWPAGQRAVWRRRRRRRPACRGDQCVGQGRQAASGAAQRAGGGRAAGVAGDPARRGRSARGRSAVRQRAGQAAHAA